ncbi:MAG: helix-turn-helix transcriptional regulator, partial [Methylocystaceae bacterium]|nr:helix-turn-helix transcriptional regulator [Methylocystaceae bacterium]
HAHASEKLDMAILSKVAECSYRTLQRGFMSAFGVTPIQYIRKVRLQSVYNEIKYAPETVPVSSIARKWGFAHMGRFAQEYQKEFGVYPKDR